MTRDEARHVAEILTAWADGETIEDMLGDGIWKESPRIGNLLIAYPDRFRIKPKPREWWIDMKRAENYGCISNLRIESWQRVREVIE